jgi:hypothetical protein
MILLSHIGSFLLGILGSLFVLWCQGVFQSNKKIEKLKENSEERLRTVKDKINKLSKEILLHESNHKEELHHHHLQINNILVNCQYNIRELAQKLKDDNIYHKDIEALTISDFHRSSDLQGDKSSNKNRNNEEKKESPTARQ